jgi:tRNA pseudouridine55 synthase
MKVSIPVTLMTYQFILNASTAFLNGSAKIHTRCILRNVSTQTATATAKTTTIKNNSLFTKRSSASTTLIKRFSTENEAAAQVHVGNEGETETDTDTGTDTSEQEAPTPQNPHNIAGPPQEETPPVQIHLAEGLFAAYKPLDWTSQDVVAYIRGMLERDARSRGAELAKRRSRKSKKKITVGHGGTLDPLATGVLVIGVGKGTKSLQKYLTGSKKYRAGVELGFETETLDMEGNRTKEMDYAHVTEENIIGVIPDFTGKISQIPPIYSALKKNGKKLYELAREGKTVDDIEIEAREVTIYDLEYLPEDGNGKTLPCFGLNVECGGGTYIRSLVRDMGASLGTCATMTCLERTQQGRFTLDDVLSQEDWTVENVYAAVERWNVILADGADGLQEIDSEDEQEEETG